MEEKQGLPVLYFESREDLERWLAENGETAPGAWLKLTKKSAEGPGTSMDEIIETALCYGWIDGQAAPLDERHWLLRVTHRRPGSKWSRKNRERAERLIAEGRMKPPGLREVEKAKADGRWERAYAGQATAEVPDDLRRALEQNERALRFFEQLDRTNRFAILYRIHDARKPETRARRIDKFIAMLSDHQKIYP